jgi:hypothetical protein
MIRFSRRPVLAGAAVLAVWVAGAFAAPCLYSGTAAFCQWDTGCYSIDPDFSDPKGQPCGDLIASCEKDGELYTGVTGLNAANKYGEGQKCNLLSGTAVGGGGDDKVWCYWGEFDPTKPAGEQKGCWRAASAEVCEGDYGAVIEGPCKDGIVTGGSVPPIVTPPTVAGVCESCVSATVFGPPAPNALFTNFNSGSNTSHALGGYWYAYGVPDGAGSVTAFTEAAVSDIGGRGGQGGYLFTTVSVGSGETWYKAGLGANLGTTDGAIYDASHLSGVYFEYKTTSGISGITVELLDEYSVENATGFDFTVKLPGTDGLWMAATLPFSEFRLPGWASSIRPFDAENLAKLMIVAAAGESGTISVDNVYFTGAAALTGIRAESVQANKTSDLRASYSRGAVGVAFSAAAPVAGGKAQLVNARGRVVASAPLAKNAGSAVTARIDAKNLPAGMYFVRVKAKDANGRRIVQQAAVSVVK